MATILKNKADDESVFICPRQDLKLLANIQVENCMGRKGKK